MGARFGDGGTGEPSARRPKPLRWGTIFLVMLAIVFLAEIFVMGLVIPSLWPEPTGQWAAVAIHAVLLSTITALALLPIFTRFEARVADVEFQLETKRKAAEESLSALSAHNLALDHLAMVVETDWEGAITNANIKFCETTGYSREEAIGSPIKLVNSKHHPASFWRDFWGTVLKNRIWQGEICNRKKNGDLYWVHSAVVPFADPSGRIFKFISIQRDITRMKAAEESTALRIRLLHALSVIAELPGKNHAECLATALEKGREALGFDHVALGHLEMGRVVFEVHSPAQGEGPLSLPLSETYGALLVNSHEVVAIPQMSSSPFASFGCFQRFGFEAFAGTSLVVEGKIYGSLDFYSKEPRHRPFDDAEKEFIFLLARIIGSVIARHNSMEDLAAKNLALDAARSQAEQHAREASLAVTAKAEFLARMSHEIRSPLNAIVGMADLLLSSRLPPAVQEHLNTLRASSDSLLTIVNNILDFSKIESGQMKLEFTPFDLRACVESVLDLNAAAAAKKRIELLCSVAPDVPSAVVSDHTRLRQILVNLVANAVKFTDFGEVVIRVGIGKDPQGRDALLFSVSDTGAGIAPESQARLIEALRQGSPPAGGSFGGPGLGLAICKKLADLLGGEIRLESTLGKGSTFHFHIPLPAAAVAALPPPPLPAPELRGIPALVVDDNPSARRILCGQLRHWGLLPREASNAQEALTLEASGTPAAIALLDAQMPGMGGYALAGELSAANPGLRIIVMAPLADRDPERLRDLPLARLLSKPVKESLLLEALVASLAQKAPSPPLSGAREDIEIAGECPMKILVAEDQITNQRIIRLMLERLGYRPEIVPNGAEALAALEREHFDALVLDIQMPVLDGHATAREICRSRSPHQRPWILAMTAYAIEGDREKCFASGMDDYISKPVRTSDLAAALRRAYNRQPPPRKISR